MIIQKENIFTGTWRTLDLDVTKEEFENWQNGMLIQDAMPRLSEDEREFLMTGLIGEEEWDKFMNPIEKKNLER
jgi:hypothetical protein